MAGDQGAGRPLTHDVDVTDFLEFEFLKLTKLNFTCIAPLSLVFIFISLPHSVLELQESG